MIRKTLKVIGWSLAGIVGLAVVLYVIVLAINWRDREPSPEAIRFTNLYRDRPAVADQDNAYIYLMGFGVSREGDPREMGARRVAWIEQVNQTGHFDAKDDPLAQLHDLNKSRLPRHQEMVSSCRAVDTKCLAVFDDERAIMEWLASEAWLLERYEAFIDHAGWLETIPADLAAPLPVYHYVLDGQRLLFAHASELATKKEYAEVKSVLARDIQFWRHVLESSDILITKMIATAALRQHFSLGNLVLRKLPSESAPSVVPAEWQVSITDSERSMLRVYVGEWVFGSNVMRQYEKSPQEAFSFAFDGRELSVGDKVMSELSAPLFQLQDYNNGRAELLAAMAAASEAPYNQYEAAAMRADALENRKIQEAISISSVYNPVGRILIGISAGSYAGYNQRVADIEGIRRAALATVALREANVPATGVSDALSQSPFRNPYNNDPFSWDAEKGAVVFTGLQSGERQKQYFLY
jgi:hypothetical protein